MRIAVLLFLSLAGAREPAAAAGPIGSSDPFEEFQFHPGFGQVARGWDPWFEDVNPLRPGSREWNVVPGASGWAQELRKSDVRIGIRRGTSGFTPGGTYRFEVRARWISGGPSAPRLSLGVHPERGCDPAEVVWSAGTEVSTSWVAIAAELVVPAETATVFLQLDYAGLHDTGVAIDDFRIVPLGAEEPPPPPPDEEPGEEPPPGPVPPSDPVPTDPALVWISDDMNRHDGSLVEAWSKWSSGTGEAEWRIVPGVGGFWAQEVRKTGVQVGVFRSNRGFHAGDSYRLRFRARKTSGAGTPRVQAGVAPEGGSPSWGAPVPVSSTSSWVEASHDFVASTWSSTLWLRADLTGLADTGVALDDVSIELLSPRAPEPWMITGAPPIEPPSLHGIHDPGAEDLFVQARRGGWVTEALAIGSDPADASGRRFPQWIDGIGVICRIAHLYGRILPEPGPAPHYPGLDAFAARASRFVKSSTGCGIWSIGNEPHLEGVQDPAIYTEAFVRTYRAIKAVRPGAKVITAGFVHGDLSYFERALAGIEERGVLPDGIALHTYTDSQGWNEVSFRDYQTKIESLPDSMRGLPLYITEAGTGGPGNPTTDTGLIDRMFRHVHEWNLAGGPQVRAVCIYRWTAGADKWSIEDNPGMRSDFVRSLARDYRWFPGEPENQLPSVSLAVNPREAPAPGAFVLNASAVDPDGVVERVDFLAGSERIATDSSPPYAHSWAGVPEGSHVLTARAFDEAGGSALSAPVVVAVTGAPGSPGNRIANGDFTEGLSFWSAWAERGSVQPAVVEGRLRIESANHNGGVFQSFDTGGAGRPIAVRGLWGTEPTQREYQWAEVLAINGPDLPRPGEDVVAGGRVGQSPVVLLYKSDTWRSPSGWSGGMSQTASVVNLGGFTAAGSKATILLKSGNLGPARVSGVWFDAIEVTSEP